MNQGAKELGPDIARINESFSSIHHRFFFMTAEEVPETLFKALALKLPQIDFTSWNQRMAWGGVFVNGIPCTSDLPLPCPCKLEYYEPRFDIADARGTFAEFRKEYIVYNDGDIVVCFKPNRLPTVPAREQKAYSLRRYLEEHFCKPVHLPSRLDMSTSGLVMTSISEKMNRPMQHLFEHRRIEKTYLFATDKKASWESLSLNAAITRSTSHPVLREVAETGGKNAVTEFRLLRPGVETETAESGLRNSLYMARPKTGRTHQIRVHASYLGLPIIGDNFYGGQANESLQLLSYSVKFKHPWTREEIFVCVPPELRPDWVRGIEDIWPA